MLVKKHTYFYVFFVLGGLFTGGMAYVVQGKVLGFSNVTILAITPAFFVGATAAVIISCLVFKSQARLREAYNNLEKEVKSRTAKLRQSGEKFRGIFDYSSSAIVIVDSQGRLIQWNKAFRIMLGYEDEELKKISFADISHPDDLDTSREHIDKIFQGDIDTFRIEKRWIRKDNSICWGEITYSCDTCHPFHVKAAT